MKNPFVSENKSKYRKRNKRKRSGGHTGTKEWAPISMNLINGCIHNCRYCYVRDTKLFYRQDCPENFENEIVRFDKLTGKIGNRKKLIMYPSTHDIHPAHLEHHIYYLRKILMSGNKVLIVTKPHLTCIDRICQEFQQFKSQITFRFTIGSKDNEVLKFWETNSPMFKERLGSLIISYYDGFQTSVSCEPLLDPNPDELISLVQPYVTDSIWIGRGNQFSRRTSRNGWDDDDTKDRVRELKVWMDNYDHMFSIYLRHKDNPLIRWKSSLRRQLGIMDESTEWNE